MQYFQQTIMGYLNYFSFRLSYNETSSHGISLAEPTAFQMGTKKQALWTLYETKPNLWL